jgi:hypothetical protein
MDLNFSPDMLGNIGFRARETAGPSGLFRDPDLRQRVGPQNNYRVPFENRHHRNLAANSSQFRANHHQQMMKNTVTPVISVDSMSSMISQDVSELNFGHLMINSPPERPRSEVMTFLTELMIF